MGRKTWLEEASLWGCTFDTDIVHGLFLSLLFSASCPLGDKWPPSPHAAVPGESGDCMQKPLIKTEFPPGRLSVSAFCHSIAPQTRTLTQLYYVYVLV